MRAYMAKYNLELEESVIWANTPSRLNSIYLFAAEAEAHKYKERHMSHIGDRIHKKG